MSWNRTQAPLLVSEWRHPVQVVPTDGMMELAMILSF